MAMDRNVSHVIADLRQQIAGAEAEVSEPVYALGSWLIDLTLNGFCVTIEYAPTLGLFGLSTQGGLAGAEEIYRDTTEVVERVKTLVTKRQVCSFGTISTAAYAWSRQEIQRHAQGSPLWAEHASIVCTFEAASLPTLLTSDRRKS